MSGGVLGAMSTAGASIPATFASVNSPVSGEIEGSGPCTTAAAAVVFHGGTGPFSYAWSKVSGGSTWVINAPTAQSTTFTYGGLAHGDVAVAEFKVVVTDTAPTPDVVATLHVQASVRSTSTL